MLLTQCTLVLPPTPSPGRDGNWHGPDPKLKSLGTEDYNKREGNLFGPGFLEKASKKVELDKTIVKVKQPEEEGQVFRPEEFFGKRRNRSVRQRQTTAVPPAAEEVSVQKILSAVETFPGQSEVEYTPHPRLYRYPAVRREITSILLSAPFSSSFSTSMWMVFSSSCEDEAVTGAQRCDGDAFGSHGLLVIRAQFAEQ